MRPVFAFRSHKVPYQKHLVPRRKPAEQTMLPLPFGKKRMEWRNLGFSSEVLQEPPQPWLDLTNLAVTKGYHSLSRLSTPDFRFFQKICWAAAPLPISTFRFGMEPNFQQNGLAFLPNCCYYRYKAAGADALRPHLTAHRTPRKAAFCGFL